MALNIPIDYLDVNDRIWFAEERQPYKVRARSKRFLICTKPYNLRRTVLYTIIDLEQNIRGVENLIFGAGAENETQCWQMLCRLEDISHSCEFKTEISRRNNIPLVITRTERPTERKL